MKEEKLTSKTRTVKCPIWNEKKKVWEESDEQFKQRTEQQVG